MNEVKTLLAAINKKQEEKLELSLKDDLRQDFDKAMNAYVDFNSKHRKAKSIGKQAEKALQDYNQLAKELKNYRQDLEQLAREVKGFAKGVSKSYSKVETAYKEIGEKIPNYASQQKEAAERNAKDVDSRVMDIPLLPIV